MMHLGLTEAFLSYYIDYLCIDLFLSPSNRVIVSLVKRYKNRMQRTSNVVKLSNSCISKVSHFYINTAKLSQE